MKSELEKVKAQRDILIKLVCDIDSEEHMGSEFYYYVNKFLKEYTLDYDDYDHTYNIPEECDGKFPYEYFENALRDALELNTGGYT